MTMPQQPTEGGPVGVTKEVIRGFTGNPSCLAAVTLAAVMAILTYLSLRDQSFNQHEVMIKVLDVCPIERTKDDTLP